MTNSMMNPRRMITRPLSFLCHVQNFNVFKLFCATALLLWFTITAPISIIFYSSRQLFPKGCRILCTLHPQ